MVKSIINKKGVVKMKTYSICLSKQEKEDCLNYNL